jgi:hypothetical protein
LGSRSHSEGAIFLVHDRFHVRGKPREELEALADPRNAAIEPAAAARAEMVRQDQERAAALVDKQIKAAADVSWATKWAAIAAIASAVGALIQALPILLGLIGRK